MPGSSLRARGCDSVKEKLAIAFTHLEYHACVLPGYCALAGGKGIVLTGDSQAEQLSLSGQEVLPGLAYYRCRSW
jgi:hypothetical protein